MSTGLKAQLEAYYTQIDETQDPIAPDEVSGLTESSVHELPRPTTIDRHARRPRLSLVALSAAIVALVLVGLPLLLSGTRSQPVVTTPEPDRTTAPTTVASTSIGAAAPAGPVEVTVEWLELDSDSPVHLGDPLILAGEQRLAVIAGEDPPDSLWTTEDGIVWTKSLISWPTHPGGLELQASAAGYWLIGGSPPAAWFSPDLYSGWTAIDLDGLDQMAQTVPRGRRAVPTIDRVARVGDETLLAVRFDVEWDWETIFDLEPGAEWDFFEDGTGEHVVDVTGRTTAGASILLPLRVEVSAEGLHLIDRTAGKEVYFVAQGASDDPTVLVRPTPDGLEAVDLPSELGGLPTHVELVQLGNSAYVEVELSAGGEFTYLTHDGVTFSAVPPLPVGDAFLEHDSRSGAFFTSYSDPFWDQAGIHWISPDGENWTMLELPYQPGELGAAPSHLLMLDAGWLAMRLGPDALEAHVDVDGVWHVIDAPAIGGFYGFPATWGDRVVLTGEDSAWVGTVSVSGG